MCIDARINIIQYYIKVAMCFVKLGEIKYRRIFLTTFYEIY